MIHEVLLRLAEQAAAIHDAQRALHKLAELGIPLGDAGGAQESVEAMAGTGEHPQP